MWERIENEGEEKLVTELKFKNFDEAWDFMQKVALLAKELNHHPNWYNSYNNVKIELKTHDLGNKISDKDILLSEKIKQAYEKY
jgi:4a-hydroxytetrahydrobiopterin dehydratase